MDIDIDVHEQLLKSVAHLRSAATVATEPNQADLAGQLNELANRIDPNGYSPAAPSATSLEDSLRSASAAVDEIPREGRPAAVDLIHAHVDDILRELETRRTGGDEA